MPKELSETKEFKIDKVYRPTGKEEEVRKWVYKRFNTMKDSPKRREMEQEWKKGEAAWEAIRREDDSIPEDWQSTYYIPLTTGVIESAISEFIEQQNRPLILPRGKEDQPRAMIMSNIYDYTWEVADGDLESADVFKGALIHGTGIAREFYLQDKRIVKDIVDFTAKTKKTRTVVNTKDRELMEYDDCMMEYRPIWDVYVDEKAREFNRGSHKARDVVDRYIMNIRDARQFFSGPVWDPFSNMQYVKPGGDTEYHRYFKPPEDITHEEDVEVLWYWARSPEDMLVIVINDVVIVNGSNPYKHKWLPFAKAQDIRRLNQFYGKGEPKLLESIQEELNTLRRMTIDRHHLDIDKTFLVGNTTTLDDEDMIARPHGVIQVDDPSNVQALEYGDIPASAQYTQRAINEDAVRATGIDDRFQSLSNSPTTATEAAILQESTQKRIKMKITYFQKGFLRDISRMRVANIQQFYSQPRLEEIVGKAGSEEYKREIAQLARQGSLVIDQGKPKKKSYRSIRLENKEIKFTGRGTPYEMPSNTTSFFEAKPEFFMPISHGGFDIKFESGATLPISKPLMQTKANEMFDRLIGVADAAGYSIPKLADFLAKAHEYNPADFKDTAVLEEEAQSENSIALSINLAAAENEEVVAGNAIPANGTPYAPPAHTEVHISFLKSDVMKNADEKVYETLVAHIMGEMAAQEFRGAQQGPGAASGVGQMAGDSTSGEQMKDMAPLVNQGGPDVQTGLPNMAQGRL